MGDWPRGSTVLSNVSVDLPPAARGSPCPRSPHADKQTSNVPAHVRIQLCLKFRHFAAMTVPHYRGRLVNEPSSGSKDPVPHFRVLAAVGGTRAEPLIEATQAGQGAAAQAYGSPGADGPDGNTVPPVRCVPVISVVAAVKAASESAQPFEHDLCRGFEFGRQHQARGCLDAVVGEGSDNPLQPGGRDDRVVVGEDNKFSSALRYADVARGSVRARVPARTGRQVEAHNVTGFRRARCVVNHDRLVRSAGTRRDRI